MATLSTAEEIIERSFFHELRKLTESEGYLVSRYDANNNPDYTIYPDTEAGYNLYETAMSALAKSKGFAIEIFGTSNPNAKGTKKVPRIVVAPGSFMPGAIGGDSTRIYRKVSPGGVDSFNAYKMPPQTVDYFMNVHLIASNINQLRILQALTANALPRRGYIPFYNDVAGTFFIENTNYIDYTEKVEGIIEKVYVYKCSDWYETDNKQVATGISPLKSITVTTPSGSIGV